MEFDSQKHLERIRIIQHGRERWPQEKNITRLFEMASIELGIKNSEMFTASREDHLPTPEESAKINPESVWVRICPNCGKKSYVLRSLCPNCIESEGGKYKTKLICYHCNHAEKSNKFVAQWMNEWKISASGTKQELGIKTITDEGLK